MPDLGEVAIVGMACIFPGAPNLHAFWQNLRAGVSAIRTAPAQRIAPAFRGPEARRLGRIASVQGGFIDEYARFAPQELGFVPHAALHAEPEQLLTLTVARQALYDAGLSAAALPARTAVIVGRGNYASAARTRFEHAVRGPEQLVRTLRELLPDLGAAELERVREAYQASMPVAEREDVVNLVPNLVASRVAERFNLTGPAYTIDAACASSLVAVEQACRLLDAQEVDLAIAGAVHIGHNEDFWSVFQQLGVLSPTGVSRPLDRRADGLVIGEGVAVILLQRSSDARAAGTRVYACVRGAGVSSDGRGTSVFRPSSSGQVRALDDAWRRARLDPSDLELLEAHATGTQTGDAVEVASIGQFFARSQNSNQVVIGSVKALIGHAMPASGMAGLIKVALSLHHGVLPPATGCEEPRADLAETRFVPARAARVWAATRRIGAVNAFGFGGINAHLVLTNDFATKRGPQRIVESRATPASEAPQAAFYAAACRSELIGRVLADRRGGDGLVRAALLAPTAERRSRLARVIEVGVPMHGRDLFFSDRALLGAGAKLVFLFPGFDGGALPDVSALPQGNLPEPQSTDTGLEGTGRAILRLNAALLRGLREHGVEADSFAGHSVGEWSAMSAGGMLEEMQVFELANALLSGEITDKDASFIATSCGVDRLRTILAGRDDAFVSHDNCPHQAVAACRTECREEILRLLADHGVVAQLLPFGSGVHSPLFNPQVERHSSRIRQLRLHAPAQAVYSATTGVPFPAESDAVREVMRRHMLEAVRFRELTERLYDDGARMFVQVGVGPLASFVTDTLRSRAHVAVSACARQEPVLRTLLGVACSAFVEGREVSPTVAPLPDARAEMEVPLGVPLVSLGGEIRLRIPFAQLGSTRHSSALVTHMQSTFLRMAEVADELVRVSDAPCRSKALASILELPSQIELSLARYPELRDHALYRQPAGWPDVRDCAPVVPLTGLLEVLGSVAKQGQPGLTVVGLRKVHARRWLNVAEPQILPLRTNQLAPNELSVAIQDFCAGEVLSANAFEARPYVPFTLSGARRTPIAAEELYSQRWMFHGPAYQRVVAVEALSESGIAGVLEAGAALGSLLDGAGQLLGLFLMLTAERDRLAMPIRIAELSYHRIAPMPGERVQCSVRVTTVDATRLVADIRVGDRRGLWVEAIGWEDRRFATDDPLWRMIRWPERNTLCELAGGRASVALTRYRDLLTFDMLVGRYLEHAEREWLMRVDPRQRWRALLSRVAAKDAVRDALRNEGVDGVFPVEVSVAPDRGEALLASCRGRTFHLVVVVRDEVVSVRATPQRTNRSTSSASG